jgi:hypothetical protein
LSDVAILGSGLTDAVLHQIQGMMDCRDVGIYRFQQIPRLLNSIQRDSVLNSLAVSSRLISYKPSHTVFALREVQKAMVHPADEDDISKTFKYPSVH